MKHIIDEDFLHNKGKYIMQCIIVTFFFVIILVLLDIVRIAIVASLGATGFIIFTIPHKNASRVQYIVGGYTVGIVVGSFCALGAQLFPYITPSIWGAVAIGLSMFLMVIFNFEHPPATALALGFAINGINIRMVIMILTIISLMLFTRWVLKKWLIDLV